MSKERAGLDLDLPDFQPRPKPPAVDAAEVRGAAERAGFTARHAAPSAPQNAQVPAPVFDGRSLRKSNRTAKLNIATTEDARLRFWMLAQRIGVVSGEDALIAMMNALENQLGGQR